MEMVRAIAGQYARYGVPFDDLVQEGLIGVLEARKRFDPDKGAKFTTYASYWVRKRILQYLDTEIKYRSNNVELNEDILSADESTQPPLAAAEQDAQAEEKLDLPSDMPEQEQAVLRMLYEQHRSLSQIAADMGLRREKVRQLKQKAMRRLRHKLPDSLAK